VGNISRFYICKVVDNISRWHVGEVANVSRWHVGEVVDNIWIGKFVENISR